jgi:flagellar L-ring protein precursor FlgH
VTNVPARIYDRTTEGHYRVKGAQTFMIGKREYKVIVTGLVRGSDMNGDEIPSSALLEPKFDIVSLKKELKL